MSEPIYQTVLFDWDGCLAQTLDIWMTALEETFADYGLYPGRAVIAANFGDWDSPTRLGVSVSDRQAFHEAAGKRVDVALPSVELYPGATDLLVELHTTGVRLGLVTSSQPHHIHMAMQRHDLAVLFDAVVTIDDVTHHKPHAEPLELALSRLGAANTTAVMVGDSSKDLGAAVNAGLDSILLFPPEHQLIYDIETLRAFDPTHICESFPQLRERLFRD
jgi:pyrophosphatase PpaX